MSLGDGLLIWQWANDRVVRAKSFTTQPIPWNDHIAWITKKLDNPDCLFLIALSKEGAPVGQVRFEIDGSNAELNYSVAEEARGKGQGSEMVAAGVEFLVHKRRIRTIGAHVKTGNISSLKVLVKAGFRRVENAIHDGIEHAHLILELPNEMRAIDNDL